MRHAVEQQQYQSLAPSQHFSALNETSETDMLVSLARIYCETAERQVYPLICLALLQLSHQSHLSHNLQGYSRGLCCIFEIKRPHGAMPVMLGEKR